MESLISAQHELSARIARTYDNLKKAGVAKISRALISSTLKLLDAKWEKVEEQHERLRTKYWEELKKHDYYLDDFLGRTEDIYLLQRSALLEHDETLSAAKVSGKPGAADSQPSPRTTLPKIQLPSFSGRYADWPSFRDLFSSIIIKDATISDVTRLHYLKTSLKGEAEAVIRSLPPKNENFDRAWQMLKDYYENTRILVRSFYSTLSALPKLKGESPTELRKLFHSMTSTVGSLESIGRPISSSEDLFVFLITERLDSRSRLEWETHISGTTEPPTYEELRQFLERRLHTLEAMQPAKAEPNAESSKQIERSSRSTRSHVAQKQESAKVRCALCHKDHYLMICEAYKSKSATERKRFVNDSHLCFNCLGKHKVSECASKKTCSVCGLKHHTSLHDACHTATTETEPAKTSHIAQRPGEGRLAVLLATARIRLTDRTGAFHGVRALIDQGSETSLITEALAQRLRLPRRKTSVAIFGVGGQQTGIAKGQVTLAISPRNGGQTLTVSAIVLPKLTVYAGISSMAVKQWTHLEKLELADPEFLAADEIDVILGADVYAAILEPGIRRGGPREPVAQQTSLGWIVSGTVDARTSHYVASSLQCTIDESLSTYVRRFWEQEEVQSPPAALTAEEKECEDFYARTHSRAADGRYVVRIPLARPLPDLSSSKIAATRMLQNMERRFASNAALRTSYVEFLNQYEQLGHMSRIESPERTQGPCCYLPHHGVTKETSTSTKLRVVFNGSLTLASGESLNGNLMVGPNLLPALPGVLLRWRRHRYVFAADVEKMYRQIRVHPEDQDLQRIVWRKNKDGALQVYRLSTVTYGLACAPFLAVRTLRQLASDEESRFPQGADILRRDVYVDDVLSGAPTKTKAQEAVRQLREICMAGGFPLRKWASNEMSSLAGIPIEHQSIPDARVWSPDQSHSTLGLLWQPETDAFAFSVRPVEWMPVTKRSVLSQAARLFDPLGWLAPVVVRAKIFIQSTWLQGLEWDTPLSTADTESWRNFAEDLPRLADIRVPRWLHNDTANQSVEIHGFADASERAYAAVIYLRVKGDQEIHVSLMTAKSKVAPTKQVSLPRLELCAAALLVKLTCNAVAALELKSAPVHLWSDSTVTLGWIRGHPSRWQTYVANRVSEIQTSLPEARWHHVVSGENPADCASRGLAPGDLLNHSLWWRGPEWLSTGEESWRDPSSASDDDDEELPEKRMQAHVGAFQQEEDPLLSRYSSLTRLLRVSAWCRRWLRLRSGAAAAPPIAETLSAAEVDQSLLAWVRVVQTTSYQEELADLKGARSVKKKSKLHKLTPFQDDEGVLRVGGRLRHALLAYDEQHPLILPSASQLSSLIVDACHARTLHGGVQQTLGLVRQRFWIPRGRALVKQRIHRCVRCLRWRAATLQPIMADLPGPRVTQSRPFQHTGVDYAGPIMLRTTKGRGHKAFKAFIAIFVCMCTRAVHVEVVSDYSAEAFLAALRRFVSRRGMCQVLYSDCGTNFVGADAALRSLFTASGREARQIHDALASDRIQWRFNPPGAPHFGGLWEAAVKAIKHHLRRVIGNSTLTFEEMSTFLAQVEACLNSRPLQPLTDDPEDTTALTPGHFLVGSALTAIPEPTLKEVAVNRLSRWQHLQQMRDHFWSRWSQEYIKSLLPRPKWETANPSLQVGRLCLMRSEITPPAKWPLGRVTALHPGDDGQVRVVTIKTVASEFTRPVCKIVPLPIYATAEKNRN